MKYINKKYIRQQFTAQDFMRGEWYYQENRVKDLDIDENDQMVTINGVVEGRQNYDVEVEISPDEFSCYCDCPRFGAGYYCKHIAAVLCAYYEKREGASYQAPAPKTDAFAARLLDAYLPKNSEAPPSLVHLNPEIILNSSGYPSFRFTVGYDKMYVVKNLEEFAGRVCAGETAYYGKSLTFCHAIENFDPVSQKLLRILIDEFPDLRSNERRYYQSAYYYSPLESDKRLIRFEGFSFDRIFELFRGRKILKSGSGTEMLLCEGDPGVSIELSAQDGGAKLSVKNKEKFNCFGNQFRLYAAYQDKVMLCSRKFADKVYPIIKADRKEMFFEKKDLPTLCDCVFSDIEDFVKIRDDAHIISQYMPDKFTACYYFDYNQDLGLTGKVKYRYGEKYINPYSSSENDEEVKRSKRLEQEFTKPLERYFARDTVKECFYIDKEEAAYDFLTDKIGELQKIGEVYISDTLNRKRVNTAKRPQVGISVSGGILTLTLDSGDFPAEELEALYKSLILKKRYHKLQDGRYLPLDGSGYEKLAEIAHMTQLNVKELQSGSVTMPAYRGLYLDRVLDKNEDITVDRNDNFRRLARDFKSVEDSDFKAPEQLAPLLRPYQKVGFRWIKTLESNGFCGILADEMGLGKTIQILAFLLTATRKDKGLPSLIVCPASLILNWKDETERFAPSLKPLVIMGNAAERRQQIESDRDSDVWVTSYDLLKRDIEQYGNKEFYCCVLDEGQNIKNQMTQASKAVKQIACSQRFVLTGTPIENRLSELWNLFDFLMPGYLFSHSVFLNRLEKPIIQSKDPLAQRQLNLLVQPFMLRRLKKDVLRDLPPKIEHVRRIHLTEEEKKVYDAAKYEARKTARETQEKFKILALLTRLRRICCDPSICFENYRGESSKLNACIELCSSLVENGHQILVFSQFTSMLDQIRKRLYKEKITNFTIEGSTPKEERAKLVKEFNNGGASVFLISLKAGGTGLNLTGADVVIHYDPWWNVAAQNQATDRAHRIGQQNNVQVYKLIAEDTIEEKILQLQEKKASLMDMLTEETGGAKLTRDEILALLE